METREIIINGKKACGINILLGNAKLILIKAEKGYLMCGYLNIATAEKLGDCAAAVSGVNSIDEMLVKNVVEATSCAQKAGIFAGMTGREALEKLI